MTREISLSQGAVALVDDEDYERVSRYKWCLMRTGRGDYPYAGRNSLKSEGGRKRVIYLHRFILDAKPGEQVDHKRSSDTLDCRRENIRFATHAQNMANRRHQKNQTGFRGVRITEYGTFAARVGRKHLGCFATAREAAIAYDQEASRLYREFARPNFADSDALPAPTKRDRGSGMRGKTGKATRAILSPEERRLIRERRAKGEKVAVLAAEFNVVSGTIYHLLRGRTWKAEAVS